MDLKLRAGVPDDGETCGRICYEAFRVIATRHNFPPDFPSPTVAAGFLGALLAHPGFYSVVAEVDGRIVGSNFLDERSTIAGVGPITVDVRQLVRPTQTAPEPSQDHGKSRARSGAVAEVVECYAA